MPAVLNAANEVAVERFLADDITYRDIPAVVAAVMDAHTRADAADLATLLAADRWARDTARGLEAGLGSESRAVNATAGTPKAAVGP
jgi:1-deoxy-D-xylulose-5-phosphate reductoisomerase